MRLPGKALGFWLGREPLLIDTHAHLTDPGLPGSVPEVLARAREAGVERVLCVGTEPDDWEAALRLAEDHPGVLAILGLHPNHAGAEAGWLERLSELLGHPRVVALGEIGLDFHRDFTPPEVQQVAFEAQLELAGERGLPVVLHVREAALQVRRTLRRHGTRRGVFHSFSGSVEDARQALELGFHLSFSGPLTFHNAPELREVASGAPHDRVLVETDSPYLSPHPWRGRPNEPARLEGVVHVLAEVWRMEFEQTARRTTRNAQALFGLP